MKKVKLNVPEIEQIEINGEVFDIQKSDIEIMNRGIEFNARAAEVKESGDRAAISAAVIEMVNFLDEILGKGAVCKIAKGRPVGIKHVLEWLTAVCGAIGDSTAEYIAEKYE